MAKGLALNIGLNRVDPTHYQDADGKPLSLIHISEPTRPY